MLEDKVGTNGIKGEEGGEDSIVTANSVMVIWKRMITIKTRWLNHFGLYIYVCSYIHIRYKHKNGHHKVYHPHHATFQPSNLKSYGSKVVDGWRNPPKNMIL